MRKVTVFGSARLKPEHPSYQQAVEFGREMAQAGWYVVTGAGGGIMEAAHVGAGREMSMGLNIMLPFEREANKIISDDKNLIKIKFNSSQHPFHPKIFFAPPTCSVKYFYI